MSFSTLSVAEYLKAADLTTLVNDSVNACAASRPHPSLVPAFLSQHFHAQHFESPTAVAVQSAQLSLCGLDGTGSPQLAVTLALQDGRTGTALVAHSCGAATSHPSSSRINRRVADLRQRSQRSKAMLDLVGLSDCAPSGIALAFPPSFLLTGGAQQGTNSRPGTGGAGGASAAAANRKMTEKEKAEAAAAAAAALVPTAQEIQAQKEHAAALAATVRRVLSNAVSGAQQSTAAAVSAAKPVGDFDAVLATADGSSNFSVLGSNLAAAVSIAFAKLRAQIQRTPLGLQQPLFRLLAKDFAASSSSAAPSALQQHQQQGSGSSNSINRGGIVFSSPTTKKSSIGNNNSGSTSTMTCPIPLVPLFGADPPVFGKLRLLKHVVVFPGPACFNSNSNTTNSNNLNAIATALLNVQQVVAVAYDKLTSDEATQQPPILLPHAGGIIKHVALESVAAVLDFVEECIKDAKLVPGQDVAVGLILDGALCSPRDLLQAGDAGGKGGASASSPASSPAAGTLNRGRAASPNNPTAVAARHATGGESTDFGVASTTASGQQQAPPAKYIVVEGGPDWSGAQLADHIAIAAASKPPGFLGYVQDCHREDDVAEMRRLMARCGKAMSIAGDDMFCSAQQVVERLAPETVANTMVVRLNEAGTLSAACKAARTFCSVVPGGSICVAAEVSDPEAVASVDFAFAVGARYLHCTGLMGGAGCQGSQMLSRLYSISSELARDGALGLPRESAAELYARINLPPEPAEPLGTLEAPSKDVKRRR